MVSVLLLSVRGVGEYGIGSVCGEQMIRLFVYGNLMRGKKHHALMQSAGGIFLCRGLCEGFALWMLETGLPFIVSDQHGTVHGEVFAVGEQGLMKLDKFQGVDVGASQRIIVDCVPVENFKDSEFMVHLHLWQQGMGQLKKRLIPSGVYGL